MIDSFGLLAGGRPAPFSLKSLHWKGRLDGLLFTYTVTQLYKNTAETPLEISYSFPMSWNSVLTDFAAEINGEVLHAEPMRKKDAEAKYEKALEKGDLPLMLECSDSANGVCTANLGCLKPGEEVKLLLTFAQVLRFELGRVRISIPTVVGDRYSADGRQGALLPHQNVTQNILANYPASAEIEIRGPVADSSVTCSNHIASFEKKDGVLTVRIDQATPNRDITLLCEGVAAFADAKFAKKADGTVASLITSVYKPEASASKKALRLKILVDCSGSMNGIPIYQAKAALRDLTDELREEDEITFSRFGSYCVHDIQSFTALTKTALRRDILPAIEQTDADMGGTEMEEALSRVFVLGGAEKADVLLITDGGIWCSEPVIETAKKSGHRVFAIGVSSSPAQRLLQDLASRTGGAASVVMPAEDMADAVSSMVRLMRSEQGAKLSLFGEEEEAQQTLFAGTGFAVPGAGKERPALDSFVPEGLKNSVLKPEGWTELPAEKAAVLEKLYALSMMRAFVGPKAAEAAQKYGVLSRGVNFILVKERAEADKCFEMPQAERVPEMERMDAYDPERMACREVFDYESPDVLGSCGSFAMRRTASDSSFDFETVVKPCRIAHSDRWLYDSDGKRVFKLKTVKKSLTHDELCKLLDNERGCRPEFQERQSVAEPEKPRTFCQMLRSYIQSGTAGKQSVAAELLIRCLSIMVVKQRGLPLSQEALFDLLLLWAYGVYAEGGNQDLLSEDELKAIAGKHTADIDLQQLLAELRSQDPRFTSEPMVEVLQEFINMEDIEFEE